MNLQDQNIIVDQAKRDMLDQPSPQTIGAQPQTDAITQSLITDMMNQRRQDYMTNRGNADYFPTNTGQVTQGAGSIGEYGMVTIAPTQALMPFGAIDQHAAQRQADEDLLNKQRLFEMPELDALANAPANVEYQRNIVHNLKSKFLDPYKQKYGKDFNLYLKNDPEYRTYLNDINNVTAGYNQAYNTATALLDPANNLGATPEMRREAGAWMSATNNMMLDPEGFDIHELAESSKKLIGFKKTIDAVDEVVANMKNQSQYTLGKRTDLSPEDYDVLVTLESAGAFLELNEAEDGFVFNQEKFDDYAKTTYDSYYGGLEDYAPPLKEYKDILKSHIENDVKAIVKTPSKFAVAKRERLERTKKRLQEKQVTELTTSSNVTDAVTTKDKGPIFDDTTGLVIGFKEPGGEQEITWNTAVDIPPDFNIQSSAGMGVTDKETGSEYVIPEGLDIEVLRVGKVDGDDMVAFRVKGDGQTIAVDEIDEYGNKKRTSVKVSSDKTYMTSYKNLEDKISGNTAKGGDQIKEIMSKNEPQTQGNPR